MTVDLYGIMGTFGDRLAAAIGHRPRRCRKEVHRSRGAAEAQMRSILRRGLAKDEGTIHVYRCPECSQHDQRDAWHVGHDGRQSNAEGV